MDNLDSVDFYIDISIEQNRKLGNQKLLSGSLVFKAQNNIFRGNTDLSKRLFEEAKSIMIAEKDTGRLVDLYLRIGGLAIDQDRLKEAMADVEKCYNLSIASNDKEYAAYALNNLAVIHTKIGNTAKGLEMPYKALELGKSEKLKFTEYQAYNNIGILYKNDRQYVNALHAYEEAEQLGHELNFKRGLMGVFANKGILFNLMKRYKEAEKEFNKALVLETEIGVPMVKADIRINQGNTYLNLGQYILAKELVKDGIRIADELGTLELKLDGHKILKEIEVSSGNLSGGLAEMDAIGMLKDSLFNLEKTKQVNEFQTKYETVIKDAEISDLNRRSEIQGLRNRGLLVGLFLLIITAGTIIYSILSKRKKDQLLSDKEKALEIEKRKNAEMELESKKKELTTKVLQLAHKNEFLTGLQSEIESLRTNVDSTVNKTSNRITRKIKRDIANDNQWEQFSSEFSTIHQGFLQTLVSKHGSFSKSEIRLISLLKMNLNSKEIASILGISPDGIKKARYRLRLKMNLEDSQLQSYLIAFS